MTLNDQINNDLKAAMKSGEKTKLQTLRLLRAHMIELSKRGKEKRLRPMMSCPSSWQRSKNEGKPLKSMKRRAELSWPSRRAELDVITSYLPKQLSADEAAVIIERIIAQTGASGAKDFGKVMPLAMKELKGKIDGKQVQEMVKAKLGA